MNIKRFRELLVQHDAEIKRLQEALASMTASVRLLGNEVNCRIEHGAESGGHLEYVQRYLDRIVVEKEWADKCFLKDAEIKRLQDALEELRDETEDNDDPFANRLWSIADKALSGKETK